MSGNEGLVDALTKSEIDAMCQCADSDRDRMVVRLLWLTAGRITEVMSLRAASVSREKGEIQLLNLKRRKNKDGSAPTTIKPLSLKAAEIAEVQDYCARNAISGSGYLFKGRGMTGHLTSRQARRIFYRLAIKAGVERISLRSGVFGPAWPHLTRHGHAMHLLRHGVDVAIVQKRLGHSQIQNTLRYLQIVTADQARALESVEL